MTILKIILIGLPALIHAYIFVLESFLWGQTRTNATFKLKPEDVGATRPLAFNQGFYNLFLAVAIILGLVLGGSTLPASIAGTTLILYGLGSILAAGLVLVLSAPGLWRSACIQIIPALAGIAAVLLISN